MNRPDAAAAVYDYDTDEELLRIHNFQRRLIEEDLHRKNTDRRPPRRTRRTKHDMSSDSEESGKQGSKGPQQLTPQGDTPTGEKELAEGVEKLVVVDEKEVGMIANLKNLYSGKEDKRGRFTWQATVPKDLGKPAEDADTLKHAIVVRYVRVWGDPRRVLALHSILIQSPLLKDLLTEVLAGYPGCTTKLQRLEFSGEFEPLIHRWTELTTAVEKLKTEAEKEGADQDATDRWKHAELFYKLLEEEFKDTIDSSQDMIKQGVITYDLVWTIFQPGCFVYTKVQGQERVFRLSSSRYGRDRDDNPCFWLTCQYVDFDGTFFGTNKLNMSMLAYEGTKTFSALAVLPFARHTSADSIRARLIERGEKVESFAGSHYRAYNGIGWRMNSMNQMEKHTVKGRVVLDAYGWNKFNPNMSLYVTAFHSKDNASAAGFGGGDSQSDDGLPPPPPWEDEGCDMDDGGIPMDGHFIDDDEEPTRPPLTEEQKLICTPIVRGYALHNKLWLNFFVNSIQDIVFNTKAFQSLVLPGNSKELILGFASTPEVYRHQFDDVVEGKGRGMVILLCGPPGTGKTLTAEGVAEEMKTPLYVMSAGELGLDPRYVETKLQSVLEMCTRWNSILLLDEADVFLEERSLHELERNKLVSIFLRVLEYYEGNMILTTNRVQTFDPAFQSRILISIDYKELTFESRRTVWSNFLKQHDLTQTAARAKPVPEGDDEEAQEKHRKCTLPHEISEHDLDVLARSLTLNGRQIKNVLKTAQLLALQRGEGLKKEHISLVLEVTQHLHNTNREKESTRRSIFS